MVLTALATAASLLWGASTLMGHAGPRLLGWVAPVLAFVVMSAELVRLGRLRTLAPAARRFWRGFALSNLINTAGLLVQVFLELTGRTPPGVMARPTLLFFAVSAATILWGLLRLPVAARTRADWVRLALDGATIMVASALFAWYFAIEPAVHQSSQAVTLWVSVAAGLLCQVAVAAVAKVLLAGTGPVDAGALRILCGGLFVASFLASFSALVGQHTSVDPNQFVFGPLALTAVLAARRQRRAARVTVAQASRPQRRSFSLLPYAAVFATQGLLVVKVSQPRELMPVVVGAVVVTCLVVVRQWGAFHDIARLLSTVRAQEERLRHQASHDGLTGLANRDLFAERLEAVLGGDPGSGAAVLFIDLDDFKTVNDTLGHAIGDGLLTAVARRLNDCVRPGDLAARLGGDEFAVVLVDCDEQYVATVAGRVLDRLAEPVVVDGHPLNARASVGVALASPGDDPDALMRNADLAMYQAKHGGKGDVSWHRPESDALLPAP